MSNEAVHTGELSFDGERYLPDVRGSMALEHLHRYFLACEFAAGKVVLDIASGEGYGSALLASVASSVTGVDLSAEAVAHAARRYTRTNLKFRHGSCAAIPMPDDSVDLVVSFETIEHHDQHEEMLREIKRVLRPGGLLVLSSPDRLEMARLFAAEHLGPNPFHVKELYRDEFESLMKRNFANVTILGQRVLFASGILMEGTESRVVGYELPDVVEQPIKRHEGVRQPLYLIAVASDQALPPLINSFCEKRIGFGDIEKVWPAGVCREMLTDFLPPDCGHPPTS
jgi:ubiquinone/menaquinone biosynthesis C-methylase UbiE